MLPSEQPPADSEPLDPAEKEKYLNEYFEICKRIYEQMERDGRFPWDEPSTDQEP